MSPTPFKLTPMRKVLDTRLHSGFGEMTIPFGIMMERSYFSGNTLGIGRFNNGLWCQKFCRKNSL